MLMLQVVQINELFEQIERSRKSQWQEVCQENSNSNSTKCRKKSKIFNPLKGITFPKLLKIPKGYPNDSQNQLDLAVGLNEKFSQEITENFASKLQNSTFLDSKRDIRLLSSISFERNLYSENFSECMNDGNIDKVNDSSLLRLTPESENSFYQESAKSNISEENFDENEINCAEARNVLSQMENNFNLRMLRSNKRENIRNQRKNVNFPDKNKSFSADFNDQLLDPTNSRKSLSSRFSSMESLNTENSNKNICKVNRSRGRSFSPEEKTIGDTITEGKKSHHSDKSFHGKPSLRSRSLESRRKSKLNVTFADESVFDVISYDENYLSEDEEKESTDSSTLEDSEDHYLSLDDSEKHNYLLDEKEESLIDNDLNRTQSLFRLQNIDFQSPILEVPENESDLNLKSNCESFQVKAIAFTIPINDSPTSEINKFDPNEKQNLRKSEKIPERKAKNLNAKSSENSKLEKNDFQNDKKRDKSTKLRISRLRPPSSYGKKENQTEGVNSSFNSKTDSTKELNKKESLSNEKKINKDKLTSNKNSGKEESKATLASKRNQEMTKRISRSTERKSIEKDKDKPRKPTKVASLLPKRQIDSLKSLNSNETVIIKSRNPNLENLKKSENYEKNFTEISEKTPEDMKSKKLFFNKKSKVEDTSNSRSGSLERKKNSLKKRVIDSLNKLKPKSLIDKRDPSPIKKMEEKIETNKKMEEKNLVKKVDEKNIAIRKVDEKNTVIEKDQKNLIKLNEKSVENNSSIATNIWRNVDSPCNERKNRINQNSAKRSRVCSKSVSQSILQTPNVSNFPRYSKEAQRLLIKKYTKPVTISNASKFDKKYNMKKRENTKDVKINRDLNLLNKGEPNQLVKVQKSGNTNFINCFKSIVNGNLTDNIRDMGIVSEVNKNFMIPLENSNFQDIQMRQSRSHNSISLASFCESETSMTRVVLETSQIIQSNSKIEEHFFANVLKRTNEECSLLKFNRRQPSNRENTMIEIRRDENYGYLKFPSINIKSDAEAKNFNSHINVRHACDFLKSNRTLCRLSLYLYIYGMLSIILIFLKINPCKYCFLESGLFL